MQYNARHNLMSGHFTDLNHAVLHFFILEKELIMITYKKRRAVTKLTEVKWM
jgi:hypothetical protein